MNNTWRKAINAVLSTFLIAGMTTMPSVLGSAAYAQSEGDVRTVQQDTGTRTDSEANTRASYDPNTGITTVQRKQDTVRLYNERSETYRQTGNRTETRYRQEPVYETRYRKEQRQRQEVQQVARTGYRQETRNETRYRPVYETKYRQVARTGTRNETRYRTGYEPIYVTQAYRDREAYTDYGYRWATNYRYEWQWVRHYYTERVLRWYTSPGYWDGYWTSGWIIYPGCYWGRAWRSRWVAGYRYAAWENVTRSYLSCDLVRVPYLTYERYAYTAYRYVTRYRSVFSYWRPYRVAYTVSVPYTYYVTESYQDQVYDLVGYRDNYGYTWVNEAYQVTGWIVYPGCYWGSETRYRRVWKYAYLGREPIYEPRQEAYQVPVTVTVAYTYYEPVTVTVTYFVDVPYQVQTGTRQVAYQVVVPVFGWVPNGDWEAREQITRTTYATLGRIGSAIAAAEAAGPAKAKSSTFMSDSGTGNTKTQIAGSKKRLVFKADEAVASNAKVAEVGTGGTIVDSVINRGQVISSAVRQNIPTVAPSVAPTAAPTPAPTPTPAPVSNGNNRNDDDDDDDDDRSAAFTVDSWVGTWRQGNYTLTITKTRSGGLDYSFAVRNRDSWSNLLGGSLRSSNTKFVDDVGGDYIGIGCDLTIEREGNSAPRIKGTISASGTNYSVTNLTK